MEYRCVVADSHFEWNRTLALRTSISLQLNRNFKKTLPPTSGTLSAHLQVKTVFDWFVYLCSCTNFLLCALEVSKRSVGEVEPNPWISYSRLRIHRFQYSYSNHPVDRNLEIQKNFSWVSWTPWKQACSLLAPEYVLYWKLLHALLRSCLTTGGSSLKKQTKRTYRDMGAHNCKRWCFCGTGIHSLHTLQTKQAPRKEEE